MIKRIIESKEQYGLLLAHGPIGYAEHLILLRDIHAVYFNFATLKFYNINGITLIRTKINGNMIKTAEVLEL
jgi:hypothetical protein